MSDPIIGRAFGPYRVISALGKGGMGEVYVAEDDRLHRRVALKFLPVAHSSDPSHKARLLAEARAVSALQHPNIVTVFDIGSEDGRDYFAMELVEGESLRNLLRRGGLTIDRAVRIAADVAAAITAAHARGIVHRDLKPENIVVTASGDAKVLDYGLAKVTRAGGAGAESTTIARTAEGAIVGTVAYMSPEQAEGRAVDHRTDIFSLGVVLYEMVAGRPPFEGKSTVDTLHMIINAEPPAVRELNAGVPAPVIAILEKALAKDLSLRYASAADMRLDLLRVKRDAVIAPAGSLSRPKRSFAIPLLATVLVATIATGAYMLRHRTTAPPAAPDIRLQPFTNEAGYEGEPTFSPDGQTIAYVSDRSGNFEIYLRQISGGPDVNITNDPADDVQPSFSPDGKEIAFVSSRASATPLVYMNPNASLLGGEIWVMPALGGMPRRIARGNFPSWSRDGKSLLFTVGPWSGQKVCRVDARGGTPVEIPVHINPQPPLFLFYPAYSPDGAWILISAQDDLVYVVPSGGGDARRVANGRSAAWNARGDGIIYSSTEADRNFSLSQIAFDPKSGALGKITPLTVGRGRDVQAAVSRDGKTVAFAAQNVTFNIERIRFDAETGVVTGVPEPVTNGDQLSYFFSIAPDARSVVYQTQSGGAIHLWRLDEGHSPVQLTSEEGVRDRFPAWSPDGRTIAFERQLPGQHSALAVMQADGANPRSLSPGGSFLSWTPDSRAIFYFNDTDRQVYELDVTNNRSRKVTSGERGRNGTEISSDGKWLLYQCVGDEDSTDVRGMPTAGGPSFVVLASPHHDFHPFFSPSGKWVYVQYDHKNLVRIPGPAQGWRKAPPQQVTFFPESNLFIEDPQITRDGKWLYYSRGRIASDIWILRSSP